MQSSAQPLPPLHPPIPGGGGGKHSRLELIKSRKRPTTTTPPIVPPSSKALHFEAQLKERGVTTFRSLVANHKGRRIELAIRAWDLQVEAGEDVGPGLLAWYIREGVEPRGNRRVQAIESWAEKRYRLGKERQAEKQE